MPPKREKPRSTTVTKDTEVTKVTVDESRGFVTIEKGLTKGLPDTVLHVFRYV